MANICLKYLEEHGVNLQDYWGQCGCLSSMVVNWAKKQGIVAQEIMIARPGTKTITPARCVVGGVSLTAVWDFHVVVEVAGQIHDAWYPSILPREQYMKENFGHYKDVEVWQH